MSVRRVRDNRGRRFSGKLFMHHISRDSCVDQRGLELGFCLTVKPGQRANFYRHLGILFFHLAATATRVKIQAATVH